MGMECNVCKKKPARGNQVTIRGKAKYLGGVGTKVTGISRRIFRPNLQRIQCVVNNAVVTLRVCTQCIRSGRITRPVKRKAFQVMAGSIIE